MNDEETAGRKTSKTTFVLDTSALLAMRDDEPGATEVEKLLRSAERRGSPVLVSFITRMELLYVVWRKEGELAAREALRLVDAFDVTWISCDSEILETAASLKAQGRISLADSWVAATAIVHRAILVHKDPEFEGLAVEQQRL